MTTELEDAIIRAGSYVDEKFSTPSKFGGTPHADFVKVFDAARNWSNHTTKKGE